MEKPKFSTNTFSSLYFKTKDKKYKRLASGELLSNDPASHGLIEGAWGERSWGWWWWGQQGGGGGGGNVWRGSLSLHGALTVWTMCRVWICGGGGGVGGGGWRWCGGGRWSVGQLLRTALHTICLQSSMWIAYLETVCLLVSCKALNAHWALPVYPVYEDPKSNGSDFVWEQLIRISPRFHWLKNKT